MRNESEEAGRNQISAGQINYYIKSFGLSPVGTVKAKGFKQENDMTVY